MKKFYVLCFLLLSFFSTQAQIKFTFNGEDVANDDIVNIKANAVDYGSGFWVVTGETNGNGNDLRIINKGSSAVSATITASVVSHTTQEPITISLCVGGTCISGTTSCTKSNIALSTSSQGTQAFWDVDFLTVTNFGTVCTTYDVVTGGKTYTVNVNFEYEDPSGVEAINANIANKKAVVYDLTGKRVSTVKHGFYIVNGKKCFVK